MFFLKDMISLHQLMLGDGRLRPPSEDWDLPISCEVGEVIEVRAAHTHSVSETLVNCFSYLFMVLRGRRGD